ncbi:hypothetical protein [Pontibaca methylaminivorans]|uniref:hypothetical protein n=1 Tax=Pontibaca methylaminivorans TaxID=515897 RepID=UPI002FD94583
MRALAVMTLALCLAAPQVALSWRAVNRQEVFPLGNGVFEVLSRPGAGPRQFWCAAADYARRVLDAPAAQRIYIHRGIGPSMTRPDYKAVQFAFQPPPGARTDHGYALSLDAVGDSQRTAAARQFCHDRDRFDDRFFP